MAIGAASAFRPGEALGAAPGARPPKISAFAGRVRREEAVLVRFSFHNLRSRLGDHTACRGRAFANRAIRIGRGVSSPSLSLAHFLCNVADFVTNQSEWQRQDMHLRGLRAIAARRPPGASGSDDCGRSCMRRVRARSPRSGRRGRRARLCDRSRSPTWPSAGREGLPSQIRARLNAEGAHLGRRLWTHAVELRDR
jgi:hypothetical protein